MSEDRSPRLGDIDDLAVEERAAAVRKGSSEKPSAKQRKTAPVTGQARPSHWMWAAVLLGVLIVVLSTWFYKQITVLQAQVDNKLSDSTQQLGNLASQLSATDESLNQSAEQISETLKLHDSEIRKLWGVSNDRNKQWIRENQESIKKLNSVQDGVDKNVASLREEIKRLDTSLKQYVIARNQMQTQIDLLNEEVKQAQSRLAAQKKAVDTLAAIQPQLSALAKLQTGEGLDIRLSEIEAAIEAFDAYRRQVNVRLDKLGAPGP